MTTAARLTDEVIDGLSGRELDRVMCLHDGAYYAEGNLCRIEGHGCIDIPRYHSDLGAAMGLLLSFDEECSVTINSGQVHVYGNCREIDSLASGPKDQAATVLCRAFLKLTNRS